MSSTASDKPLNHNIKPIDRAAVHRICSGQVILDLGTAVKELVENSLDAGATTIEVRLKEYGSELIEVADNGSGVSPQNFQALTQKYHTSKILKFSDLTSLSTFGFRGEALSSLCALADVSVTTRTKDENVATRIAYGHGGSILSESKTARAVGTTVAVAHLFSPLPVRHKELQRNVRREFGRLAALMQAYAVISTGVRILCSNQVGRSGRTSVVQTQGSHSLRENIVAVFGSKTMAALQPLPDPGSQAPVRLEGFVSKAGAGSGRASGDRQFFFVNGRPVDLPKVTKLVNEVYKSFNSLQYPMAFLNFRLPTDSYDVNLTPDKRKVMMQSEPSILACLREALEAVYSSTRHTFAVSTDNGRMMGRKVEGGEDCRDVFRKQLLGFSVESGGGKGRKGMMGGRREEEEAEEEGEEEEEEEEEEEVEEGVREKMRMVGSGGDEEKDEKEREDGEDEEENEEEEEEEVEERPGASMAADLLSFSLRAEAQPEKPKERRVWRKGVGSESRRKQGPGQGQASMADFVFLKTPAVGKEEETVESAMGGVEKGSGRGLSDAFFEKEDEEAEEEGERRSEQDFLRVDCSEDVAMGVEEEEEEEEEEDLDGRGGVVRQENLNNNMDEEETLRNKIRVGGGGDTATPGTPVPQSSKRRKKTNMGGGREEVVELRLEFSMEKLREARRTGAVPPELLLSQRSKAKDVLPEGEADGQPQARRWERKKAKIQNFLFESGTGSRSGENVWK